jgi:hypothetical protein
MPATAARPRNGTARLEAFTHSFRDLALARLTPLHLFESGLQLMFIYKVAFEAAVVSRATPLG